VFEFLKKKEEREGEKKFKKNSKTHNTRRRSLVFLVSCFTATHILSDALLSFLISESDALTSRVSLF